MREEHRKNTHKTKFVSFLKVCFEETRACSKNKRESAGFNIARNAALWAGCPRVEAASSCL